MDRSPPRPKRGRGEALRRALQAKREAEEHKNQEAHAPSAEASADASESNTTDVSMTGVAHRGRGRMELLARFRALQLEEHPAEPAQALVDPSPISNRPSRVSFKTDASSGAASRPRTPIPLPSQASLEVASRPRTPIPLPSQASSGVASRSRTPIALPSQAASEEKTTKIQVGKPLEISRVEPRSAIPVTRSGSSGKPISLATNFIRLDIIEGCGIFEYEVTYVPNIDVVRHRFLCLNQHRDIIGTAKMFDGKKLILPVKLKEENTILQSEVQTNGETAKIQMSITFKGKKPVGDPDCIQLFNVIYNRVFKELNLCPLQRSGPGGSRSRNYFDPTNKNSIQKHGVEVWPGYVIAVDEFEGGVQLQVDSVSRIMRTETVKDTITDCLRKHGPEGYKEATKKLLLGTQIITRYNNATYKVDEVDFEASPQDVFTDEKGQELKMTEYYKHRYNITVKDEKQPLLVNYKLKPGLEKPFKICLIPELCFGVGLTDAQREDFRVMKDIATFTRLRPTEKQEVIKKLLHSIANNEKAKAHLTEWGLKLNEKNLKLQGRLLDSVTLHFGGGYKEVIGPKGDWGRTSTSKPVLKSVDLKKWCLIYPRREEKTAKSLVQVLCNVSPKMGLHIEQPKVIAIAQDRNEEYLKAIRDMPTETQLALILFPGAQKADRYAAVKKLCNIERPVPSQVVMQKTLSNEKRIQAVVQKIALQMNAKLGGELWGLKIPLRGLMVIGIDVYRDKGTNGTEIAGIVASLDPAFAKYYSDVVFKTQGDNIIDCLRKCIIKYREHNGELAKHIVIYRDGMGSGQLNVAKTEGANFATLLQSTYKEEQIKAGCSHDDIIIPSVSVIVVQKRLNTKLFYIPNDNEPALVDNPPAGTVMDHTITHRNWYDFYLVPMNVMMGTISPTHFTVVYDDSKFSPDIMQKLAYALTHMYFNWPGNVKVPAPCQYSHKLVELVGDHMHNKPNDLLKDKLFYL